MIYEQTASENERTAVPNALAMAWTLRRGDRRMSMPDGRGFHPFTSQLRT